LRVEGIEEGADGNPLAPPAGSQHARSQTSKTEPRAPKTQIALEVGRKRAIASALDWPGWARVGGDEQAALETLWAYGPRYRRAIGPAMPDLRIPDRVDNFVVAERLTGDATTDYGVPGLAPSVDAAPLDDADQRRLLTILAACWDALDTAAASAEGRELRKGPRGGGRSTPLILDHVIDAHFGYLRKVAWREPHERTDDRSAEFAAIKEVDARAVAFAMSGEMPATGPRGGKLWTPRYFVRRAAWHILDHAWEIEDRLDG
jgi:hypothetical protein